MKKTMFGQEVLLRHFYWRYQKKNKGSRSYPWVKNALQKAGEVAKAPANAYSGEKIHPAGAERCKS